MQRFERFVAACHGTLKEIIKGQFIQFVADNVDHNTGTLDSHGIFHGMGIVTAVSQKLELKTNPRCLVTTDDLAAIGKNNIHFYRQQSNNMDMMAFIKGGKNQMSHLRLLIY